VLTHWLFLEQWLSNKANPILVRVTRQQFRNRRFVILFLGLLFLSTSVVIIFCSRSATEQVIFRSGAVPFAILTSLWFLIINMQALENFSAIKEEANDNTWDLLKVSRVGASDVISGYCLVNLLFSQLYGAALSPFIVISYFFGGISMANIILVLIAVPFIGVTMGLFGIFFGALASSIGGGVFFRMVLMVIVIISWLISVVFFANVEIAARITPFTSTNIAEGIVAIATILLLWVIVMFALWTTSSDLLKSNSFPAYQPKRNSVKYQRENQD
jgi:hypothetical protein